MPDITLDRKLLNKPKQKYWITYIKQRIKKNKNFLGFVSGPTGSGKSWSSLRIGEQLDKDFNIDRVVFTGLELMKLINSDKLSKGSVIVFEEVGVEMNNRNWASVTNKMLNYLIQTFRHRCFVLIMNSPYMDFVDSATRKLFHAEMQTVGINFKTNECRLKPQLIQYNSRMSKFYYKRLRVIKQEGVIPISIWNVKKPSKEMIKAYESKKRQYTDKLNTKIMNELQELKEKSEGKPKLTQIQQDTVDMLKDGLTVDQIAITRDRTKRTVQATISALKNKGYEVRAIKEGKRTKGYEVIEPE